MGLFEFLPFNTIRNVYNYFFNAHITKKATEDAIKEVGLDGINVSLWTTEQFLDMFTIRNQILHEQGMKGFCGKRYKKNGIEMIAFDSGIYYTKNGRPINIEISIEMATFREICSKSAELNRSGNTRIPATFHV
jgi:hypothetical protein